MDTFETKLFINNEYVSSRSGRFLSVANPYDGSTLSNKIHCADDADVDAAVRAASKAFKTWSRADGTERAQALFKFADLMRNSARQLALLDTRAMGSAVTTQTLGYQAAANLFTYYAGFADKIHGEAMYPSSDGKYKIVQREPIGICAGIGAWNVSSLLFAWKAAPALAAGNTFIFKPSEKAPLGVLALGHLIKQCFPPGVINVVNGDGRTGAALSSHMGIRQISFTGSTDTGRKIQEAAVKSNLKRVSLELGGKSPSIIFEDADLDRAVAKTVEGFVANTGQICAMASRIFVHESIAEKFSTSLQNAVEDLKRSDAIGDPTKDETMVGPIADKVQFDRVSEYLSIGDSDGKRLYTNTSKPLKGLFIEPTIFTSVPRNSRLMKEEVFGPVVAVTTFRTEAEAVELANDSVYGLSACVFTNSLNRALRVIRDLETGTVAVNDWYFPSPDTPYGGVKQSGYGREGGLEGLNEYLQTKTIQISTYMENSPLESKL